MSDGFKTDFTENEVFRTSVDSLYVDAHELSLGARRAKFFLQYVSKIKSSPKYCTHNAVFGNKCKKLFDVTHHALCKFGLSDILATLSYFVLPSLSVKPPQIVHGSICLSVLLLAWKYETSIVTTFLFIQMVHGVVTL